MSPIVKRVVLVGIAVVTALAVYANFGRTGLPAADPAAARPAPTSVAAAPGAEQARGAERAQELQQRLAENPRDQAALSEMVDGLFAAKRYGPAAELLYQALESGPDNSRLRVGLGLAFFYQGMPSLAQRELKRAIELDQNNAQAHFNYALSVSHGPKADLDAARRSWEEVVRIDGDGELGRKAREFLGQAAPN